MKNEDGFSLIELLVVLGLLSIVGASILTVATTTLRAERTAEDLARNLDDTRIAVERVRDEVRGADGVCQDSDAQAMTVWTDRNADGTVDPGEVVTFELVDDDGDGEMVLQREDDAGTRRLAGRLTDADGFTYLGPGRTETAPTLDCSEGTSPGASPVAIVDLFFEVEGDGVDTSGPLSVETTIVLRNAGLVSSDGGGSEPALRVATIVVEEVDEAVNYEITVDLEGVDLSHPVDDVTFEIRCGEEAEWASPVSMTHAVEDDGYSGNWDSSACDADDATVLVTARDGEEEATGQVVIELVEADAEPEELGVRIDDPGDGAVIDGDVAVALTVTGVLDAAPVDATVTVERDADGATVFDQSLAISEDGAWGFGTWDASAADDGSYSVIAHVNDGERVAQDEAFVTVDNRPSLRVSSIDIRITGNWQADVEFFVTDSDGNAVDGAEVSYTYDVGPSGDAGSPSNSSCETSSQGQRDGSCTRSFPSSGNLDDDEELRVTITDVALDGYRFDSAASVTTLTIDEDGVVDP